MLAKRVALVDFQKRLEVKAGGLKIAHLKECLGKDLPDLDLSGLNRENGAVNLDSFFRAPLSDKYLGFKEKLVDVAMGCFGQRRTGTVEIPGFARVPVYRRRWIVRWRR